MCNLDDLSRNDIKQFLNENNEYKALINEMMSLNRLISDYSFLSSGKDFISFNKCVFSPQKILLSVESTLSNIIMCCNFGCIADANTLFRKFRDDLFFYMYVLVYFERDMQKDKSKTAGHSIACWLNNKLKYLKIEVVLDSVFDSNMLSDIAKKYNLKESFKKISERLNNYVHSNGYIYYNDNTALAEINKFLRQVEQLTNDLKYCLITFFVLLSICHPHLIASSDYFDFIEFGQAPPDGLQYFVAPFIEKFIKDNYTLIDKNCLEYLQDNCYMKFDFENC